MKKNLSADISCTLVSLFLSSLTFGLTFTQGHYYGTYTRGMSVSEYDESGQYLGYITLQDDGYALNGLASGPDGLMYGVIEISPGSQTKVVAFDSDGTIHHTHNSTDFSVIGNTGYGNIDFGSDEYF